MKIQNAHCVVTGAGRGLGKEIAMELSSLGAIVHACDINDEALSALRNDTDNSVTTFHTCDVSDENNVKKMFAELEKVDVLINNAGIIRDGLLVKVRDGIAKTMPLEDFSGVLNVNLIGVFLCAREASVRMIENGGGVIVNISSVSRSGNFGQTNYSAAKAGVDAMTVVWSKELARHNIRCAAIAPGYINTEMVASINPDALVKITNQVPLKRLGEMSEIAETARFIIENDFVNGRILEIDGGLRI